MTTKCREKVPTRPGRVFFPVPLFARCSRNAVAGSLYCKQHTEMRRAARAAAQKKEGA